MPSFDIESTINKQEVTNATDQAGREITTRYDFKGTQTSIMFSDDNIEIISSTEERMNAANQVLVEKLVKRKVSPRILSEYVESKESKGHIKRSYALSSGITQDNAKILVKEIKKYNKKIQTAIQGASIRVSGKKRDELQEIMNFVKNMKLDYPVNFKNFKD